MVDRTLNYGRQNIAAFVGSVRNANLIVDLGAGSGDDLRIARSCHPTAILHAVECWPPNVAELARDGIEVHQLDIERNVLPFRDGSVDIVIANQVLEHTKELFWIFHEVTRVLRVGGSFVIGVPNLASLHNRVLLLLGRQPTPIRSASAHVRGFTKPDLMDFVDTCFESGYEVLRHGGSNFYPFPRFVATPLAKIFPSLAWGLFVHLVKSKGYSGEFASYPSRQKLETNFFVGSKV